MLLYAVGKDNK